MIPLSGLVECLFPLVLPQDCRVLVGLVCSVSHHLSGRILVLVQCRLPHGPSFHIRHANVVVYPYAGGRSKFVVPLILLLSGP